MEVITRHLGHLACVGVLFLLFVGGASGQPGCGSMFGAYEACAWPIQTGEYVFLGRVVSVAPADPERSYGPSKKLVVEVEAALKGNLARTVDLTVVDACYGMIREGGRHLFTAARVDEDIHSGLVSKNWSSALDPDQPKAEIAALLAEIRSVIGKVKQPRLVGTVIEQGWSPHGRYLIPASSAARRLGYDPNYARPVSDVVVTVRRKDGLEFRTATGEGGRFIFKELPKGMYEIFTDLPEEYDIDTHGTFHTYEGEKGLLQIDDSVCSSKVSINAQLQGEIKVRISGVRQDWSSVVLSLFRLVPSGGGKWEMVSTSYVPSASILPSNQANGDVSEHVFKEVPVGPYTVMLNITTDPNIAAKQLYYPGTNDSGKAGQVLVRAAKTTTIDMTIPEFSMN